MTDLAVLLAAHPTAVAALLAEHVDDGAGHCRVCSAGAQTGRYRWPCSLASIARGARTATPPPES